MTDEAATSPSNAPSTPGGQLRAAREQAGMDLADVAARTRIPLRHLEALEADDYNALPSPTYSTGFAKAYARAVGADEVAIAGEVRRAISLGDRRTDYVAFEPADPARTPPKTLAWTAVVIAVLLLVGYGVWRNLVFEGQPGEEQMTAVDPGPAAAAPAAVQPAAAAVPTAAPVVLTANDSVWLRITDAGGQRLFERELAAGDRYEVPADANGPRILTGRPQALTITVGDRQIPPLGPADRTVSNVPVDAQSLLALANGTPAAPGS